MQESHDKIRTTARPCCFFCGSEGKALYRDLPDGLYNAPGLWNVRQCPKPNCGLLWLDPAPVEEDLHIAYRTYFTHAPDGGSAFIPWLRGLLYGGYKSLMAGIATAAGLRKAQMDIRMMFLRDLRPGRVLDVGCGDGTFLNVMRDAGWTVDGVDFDAKAIENAKAMYGLQLRHGDLRSVKFPADSFDAVTLSHVIEHVPDPVALLAEVRRILKPGGRLTATTPNNQSSGHEYFEMYWVGLDPPRHLNVFNLPTLRECAQRAGFKKVEVSSTAANADIVAGGSYSVQRFRQCQDRPQINIVRALRCAWFQHREFRLLRRCPERGEEAVLVCAKDSP